MKLRKILIFVLFMFASVFALNLSVNVKAASGESVVLANGNHDGTDITWTAAEGAITITQTKATGSTAVSANYISAPRVYKGHILKFEAAGNVKITSISITCSGSYYGNSMTAGITISDDVVTDDTSSVSRTWTSTEGGTHVVSSASASGLSNIYIQNVATTNKQLRITQLTISYIEVSVSATEAFTMKNTMASLNVSYTQEGEESWDLVTDAAALSAGDKVVIVASGSAVALSTTQNNNNRGQAAITKENDSVIFGADVQVLTLETGNKSGTFAFNTGSGYLYAASSSSNNLKTKAEKDDNASWTIAITEGVATIVAQGTYTRNTMQYNSSSSLFACYGSASQAAVSLYKHIGSATYEVSSASIMFGTLIEEELYTNLTSVANTQFGVIYGVGKSAEELKAAIAEVNAGTKTFEDMKTATGLRSLAPEVAKVNEEGVEDANGTFYQFGVSINNIAETKFDTEVVAAAYVLYEGQYYLASVRLESLNSVAQLYVDTKAEDPMVSSHLGMLQWLATYSAAE